MCSQVDYKLVLKPMSGYSLTNWFYFEAHALLLTNKPIFKAYTWLFVHNLVFKARVWLLFSHKALV